MPRLVPSPVAIAALAALVHLYLAMQPREVVGPVFHSAPVLDRLAGVFRD